MRAGRAGCEGAAARKPYSQAEWDAGAGGGAEAGTGPGLPAGEGTGTGPGPGTAAGLQAGSGFGGPSGPVSLAGLSLAAPQPSSTQQTWTEWQHREREREKGGVSDRETDRSTHPVRERGKSFPHWGLDGTSDFQRRSID